MGTYFDDNVLKEFTNNFHSSLKKEKVEIIKQREIPYGIQFFLEDHTGEILIVNVYNGKKGLKIVMNNKNSPIYPIAVNCINRKVLCPEIPFSTYIGTDESGKGDYFGPLVVAGFVVDDMNYKELESMGIRDSKTIEDKIILELGFELFQKYSDNISVYAMIPEKYNTLYSHMKLQRKNLNDLLALGHARVIEELAEAHSSIEGVVSDQFGNTRYIQNALMEKGKQLRVIQITRAEKDMAVAAASVIARYEYLKWIEEISGRYKVIIPKGADYMAVDVSLYIIDCYGVMELKKLVKLHFKTTKDVLSTYYKSSDTSRNGMSMLNEYG